ncbi:unnamed protein product [Phytomonas sp. Hart1]|nr:unnamed protein product [Phytomonas sp. Hart1]|eukprot:CCW67932.1 unnamed protein product [Phytomonas sp. isolate Hart1]
MLFRSFLRLRTRELLIPSLVQAMQRDPVYLRSAPPSLYITCDTQPLENKATPPQRHLTRLLDYADDTRSLQTFGVYALTTTTMEDTNFENEKTLSTVLIGLPKVRNEEDARRFVEMHESSLRGLDYITLPDIHSSSGCALKAIQRRFPKLRIACGAFAKAFLTDSTFFDGVRKAIRENSPEEVCEAAMVFAEVDEVGSCVELVDGLLLPLGVKGEERSEGKGGRRSLQVCSVPLHPLREERWLQNRRRQNHPPHFNEQLFFFYDTVFEAMHVGASSVGWLPWLAQILTESHGEMIFPLPPLMAAQHNNEDHLLLEVWRVQEAVECFTKALHKVSYIQRVLSAGYGELPGDAEDIITSLDNTAYELEKIRNRLAKRLTTDTGRDISKWSELLLSKILKEIVCANKEVSESTSNEVHSGFQQWAINEDLGRLCRALTRAALTLPHTEIKEPENVKKIDGLPVDLEKSKSSTSEANIRNQKELEGPQGVVLLQSIFEKKGLQGLNKVLKKEEIDVRVFLAMKPEDFRLVFKTTFGLSKRLEILQTELKQKIPSSIL